MPENEIIAEIHCHRAELARRCDFDIQKLMAFYREHEAVSEAAGRKLVSLVQPSVEAETSLLREDAAD